MAEETGVRVRLVLNTDLARRALDGFKAGLGATAKAAGSATGAAQSMSSHFTKGMGAGAIAVGNLYAELAKLALHWGKEAFMAPLEAFMESGKQIKALAGTFSVIDKGGKSFEELKDIAGDVKDELEDFGIAAGVADDELLEVFTNVIERGGKSIETARDLTEQMAYAGRAIPGGAKALSEGFEALSMGIVRAKNPLVGLIASTGTMKGNAKQVATEMQKLSPDKQIALAEKAIEKMSGKMKNVPLTFGQMVTSMKVLGENVLEEMGQPMMKGLGDLTAHIRSLFVNEKGGPTELTEKLMTGARKFGEFLRGAFDAGEAFIDGFSEGLKVFSDEFAAIWHEVFGEGDSGMKSMVGYAKAFGQEIGMFVKSVGAGIGAIIVATQRAIKELMILTGDLLWNIGYYVPGAGKLAEAGKAVKHEVVRSDIDEIKAGASKYGGMSIEEAGKRTRELGATFGVGDEASWKAWMEDMARNRRLAENNVHNAELAAQQADAAAFAGAFQEAAKGQDDAAQKAIAGFLKGHEQVAWALGTKGPELFGEAKDKFLDALKDSGLADLAKDLGEKWKASTKIDVSKGVTQNFTGPITIKQDFKDEDPDRVVVAIKEGLGKFGTNRLQARGAPIFG